MHYRPFGRISRFHRHGHLAIDLADCENGDYGASDRPRSRHEETIAGFQDLERDGKILSWGVSNFDADDIEDAMGSQDRRARISPAIRFFITWGRSASLVCPVRSGGDGLQPLRPWQFSGS